MTKLTKKTFVLDKLDKHNMYEWDLVASSSIFKDEYKQDEAEKGVIYSYANALECITESLIKQNHSPEAILTIRHDSLTIPFIFLARHTVELSLKYVCRLLDIEYAPKHSLMILWDKILLKFQNIEPLQNDDLIDIKTFISALEELDCDGARSRYAKNNNGKLYNNKPKFINVIKINDFVQNLFIKLINSIHEVKN